MSYNNQRQLIAEEAARIMDSEAIRDFALAKRKAIQRLGLETKDLPSNAEIQTALLAYQRLFNNHQEAFEVCIDGALEAMRFFEPYQPKLVGPLVEGIAFGDMRVTLHLTAESVEEVIFFISDNRIPYREGEKRYSVSGGKKDLPCVRFIAGEIEVEVVILIEGEQRGLRSPVDGAAIKGLDIHGVGQLKQEFAA